MLTRAKTIVALVVVIAFRGGSSSGQTHTGERAQWFVEDRFGMFIHWGLYSGAEGVWKGEKLRYDNDYAEWIQYRNRIGRDEYLSLVERFDWDAIDPEEWVLLAKRAGMRYVTITAKHHDGFALWDSASSDYNVANVSPGRRDIIKELAASCRKHGLKLGLYYSHWVDWEHPQGWDHSKEVYPIQPEQFDRYWQEKVIPQMRELLTGYGDIGLIWFDMWVHHSETIVTRAELEQLKRLIRELQPDCLINSRLGLSIEEDPDVDFQTMSDNELGNRKLDVAWQTPATVAHSWGYHALDREWKSTATLLQALINNVSLNGNLMLNIGPRANGDVPLEIVDRLEAIGRWLETNGDSIYRASAYQLRSDLHDWGRITFDPSTNRIFLHVYRWPFGGRLTVTGTLTRPSRIYLLADRTEAPLAFEHRDVVTRIEVPESAPDPYASVIVIELAEPPAVVDDLVAQSTDGGYSLLPTNAFDARGESTMLAPIRFGSVPAHVEVARRQLYRWRVFIDEPARYRVDASYSYQSSGAGGNLRMTIGDETRVHQVEPTGKTVGEPRSDWVIDSFESRALGDVSLETPGYYDIDLEIDASVGRAIKFQWLWLEKR